MSKLPPYHSHGSDVYRPEVLKTIEEELDKISSELRELSIQIHDRPELKFQEKYAHDVLTKFMSSHHFEVTPHFLGLETAWRATFKHGRGGRVIGVNSEMDALPGIGHACGHNLIAIIGVGISLAIRAALVKHDVPGEIVLYGTPGEEGGGGKVMMIERGGYKEMDACLMAHPGVGGLKTAGTGSARAINHMDVEFFGHTAHASAAPWEAQNALDAAFLTYANVAVLRQQIKPTHRVHGIVEGKDWAANIIPDYAKMNWIVRAPTAKETQVLYERVHKCFQAAALATDTQFKVTPGIFQYDLAQNETLANEFSDIAAKRYGIAVDPTVEGAIGGSTDFGNVTYTVPSLHPSYAIPSEPNGGNHTAKFTASAGTQEAHDITMDITKILALMGFRVIDDGPFFEEVKRTFVVHKERMGM